MEQSPPSESDFIIVGGGTAGLVLARRLSEGGHFSVHVIEAGGRLQFLDPSIKVNPSSSLESGVSMPAVSGLFLDSSISWGDKSTPQANSRDRQVAMPAGKVLGGSTNLNYALWTRGNVADYNLIKDLTDDSSWGFDSLECYFKKSEDFKAPLPVDPEHYGSGGPIHVEPVDGLRRGYHLSDFVRKAYIAAGFQYNGYGNDGRSLGFNELGQSIYRENGGRQSSVQYIKGDLEGPKLYISTDQQVASVLVQESENKAIGVKLVDGNEYKARKEVLLCAGALRSPAILQLSGIGDQDFLNRLGIQVVHHLPGVGKNLWDHPVVYLKWRLQENHAMGSMDVFRSNPAKFVEELNRYNEDGSGMLAGTPFEFTAWKNYAKDPGCDLRSALTKDLGTHPGETPLPQPVQNYLLSDEAPHAQFLMAYGYPFAPPNLQGSHVSVNTVVATPTSRGYVRITSDDPKVPPECNPRWLSTEVDRAIMKSAMKTASQIIEKMVDEEGKQVVIEEVDVDNVIGFTEESLEEKLKAHNTIYHYAGTCSMGPATNPSAVVGSHCKVHGLVGLRVIDASVFPVPISANTQAPVYALAEKMADNILEEYRPYMSQL